MTEPKTKTTLKTNEYRCSVCGGIFDKGWTDEEAQNELNDNFPCMTKDDCGLVCDDCYKSMGFT